MGAAGGRTPSTTNGECVNIKRAPHKRPPFTLSQLKKAIPPHCFRRSLLRSSSYLLFDLSLSFLLFYLATTFLIPTSFHVARWWWWPVYWALQGCILTGVWVTGHECGHHAFSEYQWLDDAVGFALHSALLVPYFSWKYSHRRHHSNIGSLDRDEVFVPKTKSSLQWYLKYFNNAVGRALTLVATLLLGWPLYLAFNMSGRPYDRFACHFDPYSPIYSNRERFQVFISDVGVIAMSYFIYTVAASKGIPFVLCTYGVPLLIVNSFLVLITYLQHTHPALPHYSSSEWDWLRGALVTVDRDYGVLNAVFHHITDTHVVHHLFSTMPHYHAVEATRAVVPLLGEYYRFDSTPVVKALWREAKECLYVEADDDDGNNGATKGVFWYHNKF